ncbi:MAG: PAS domain-containing protein [Spirochaetota bacterium]|nr:PAS domain-containing protein [Spirochaetota bacterium]
MNNKNKIKNQQKNNQDVSSHDNSEIKTSNTKKIHVDKKYYELERNIKIYLENTPDIIMVVSKDGIIHSINRDLSHFPVKKGKTPKSIYDFVSEGHREILSNSLNRVFETRKPEICEIQSIGAYGPGTAWYECRIIPIIYKNLVKAATILYIDITARNQTCMALMESKEQYHSLIESTEDAVYLIDRYNLQYLYANKKYLSRLELTLNDIIGKEYGKFHSYDETEEFMQYINQTLKTGKSIIYEHQSQRDKRFFLRTISPVIEAETEVIKSVTVISKDITDRKQAEEKLKQNYNTLRRTLDETVLALSAITETRDPYTAGHQQRMTLLACAIAKEMDLPEDQIEGIRVAGTLHDIGKISVPIEILNKPGRLSELEISFIKTHSKAGYDILKMIEFPWPVAQIVLQHHERCNGSGYPSGLSADKILAETKIISIADVVEAISFHRPYRAAYSIDKALDHISENRGILYNTDAVKACLKLFRENIFKFDI